MVVVYGSLCSVCVGRLVNIKVVDCLGGSCVGKINVLKIVNGCSIYSGLVLFVVCVVYYFGYIGC